ncbi:unnamed protein product [Microthlaspi erraticum]|uniref:Reverse transcriptase domain-containing protein n=1 Tax=Microthlaspi erraticum TaxID=1685480 RepID=A0A6D2JXT3_9BRAS|nr:unnamed protein product [Microthlaspi erraticum]
MIDVCEGTIELNLGKDLRMKFDIKDTMRKPTIEGQLFYVEEMDQLADELLEELSTGGSPTSCFDQGFFRRIWVGQASLRSHGSELDQELDRVGFRTNKLDRAGTECKEQAQGDWSELKAPKVDLKPLPEGLRYAFLGENSTYPVIVNSDLEPEQLSALLVELRKYRKAIGYTLDDIKGISPDLCIHRIHLEDESKSSIEPQRRLNPNLKEVVKKEILKLLDAGIIYPISDSTWISPVHCVPKKGGITVIKMTKRS